MAKKKLDTLTRITYDPNEETVKIRVEYNENLDPTLLPNTLQAQITEVQGVIGATVFQEGELLLTLKNHPQQINYKIDKESLILFTTTGDASQYRINEQGELLYDRILD